MENLIEHFQDQSDIFGRLAIYSYRFKRQTSDFDCTAFTLLDLKNLLEMHLQDDSNIIDFYQLQKENLRPEFSIQNLETTMQLPVFELSTLPPQMMKATQSFQQIARYKKRLPEVPFISIVKRYKDMTNTCEKVQDIGELLTRVQSSTRINSKNKPQNLYAEQKHMQLIVYLLSDSILQFEEDSALKRCGNTFSQSSELA